MPELLVPLMTWEVTAIPGQSVAPLSDRLTPARGCRARAVVALLLLAILSATAAVWIYALATEMPVPGFELSAESSSALIRSWGVWGVAGTIALMVVHAFIPFPAEFVALAAGMVYGPVWGTAITWTGAMLGAMLSFLLGRWLGRPFIERILSRDHRDRLDRWTERQGPATILAARLVPVIAFNLINYAAGLTRVSGWTFAWATGLGILPLTALMVMLGHSMTHLSWWAWIAMIVAALALWILVWMLGSVRDDSRGGE